MEAKGVNLKCALALALAGLLAAGPVMADKPSWAGKGGKGEHGERERDDDDRGERHRDGKRGHFKHEQRKAIHDYYDAEFRRGHCPPGLAKKHNGCMPPGQAKKWKIGQPLPREVVFEVVPPPLVIKIGAPPSGYKYVRVASDILMIAVGTSKVVDAIHDLGR